MQHYDLAGFYFFVLKIGVNKTKAVLLAVCLISQYFLSYDSHDSSMYFDKISVINQL